MRMRRPFTVLALVLAFMLPLTTASLSAQSATTAQVTINANGAPADGMQVMLALVNKGKVPAGTTDMAGQLVLDLANMPKIRVEVALEECPDGTHIVMTQPGAAQDDRCRRRLIGFWLWGNGNLVIDTGTGTLQVIGGQPFLTTPRGLALLGGGAAAAVGVGLAAGGGSSTGLTPTPQAQTTPTTPTTPTAPPPTTIPNVAGTYHVSSITVVSDPHGHRTFVNYEICVGFMLPGTQSGNTLTIPGGSPWVNLVLQINPANGAVTGSGTTTAAGRSNVQWSVTGSKNARPGVSGKFVFTLQISIGNNGTLPNGPIVYALVLTGV